MAIRLAESLADRRRYDPEDILAHYLAWWRNGAFDTGRPTAATVLGLIKAGIEPAEAVKRVHEPEVDPWRALVDALATAKIGRLQPTIEALNADHPCPLSRGGYAPDVLRAAIHFVIRHDAFADALNDSLDFARPENYCPALVGAMAGARWGVAEIPVQMLLDCELLDRFRDVSDHLRNEWEEIR